MKKTILFIIAIALVLPFSVKAECDYEREAELSRIASNVQFSYTYRMNNNGSLVFDVNIINVPEDIYIIESENNNKIIMLNEFEKQINSFCIKFDKL